MYQDVGINAGREKLGPYKMTQNVVVPSSTLAAPQ